MSDNNKGISEKQLNNLLRNLLIFILCLFLIIVVIYLCNFPNWFSEKQSDWGAFGDYINGILSPFISIVGFIAVIITIRIGLESRKKEDDLYRLSMYIDAMKTIENELDKTTEAIIWAEVIEKKVAREKRDLIYYKLNSISNMFLFLYKWLELISEIDQSNPFIYQYSEKYLQYIEILASRNWIESKNVIAFFRKSGIQNIYPIN